MKWVGWASIAVLLGACALTEDRNPPFEPEPAVEAPQENAVAAPDDLVRPEARPEQGQDGEVSVGTFGRTVASLGNAAEPGLWLKTPLVSVERQGQIYAPKTNMAVKVTLIPIDGPDTAGSRLSLEAMRGLGVDLTDLVEIDVLAG